MIPLFNLRMLAAVVFVTPPNRAFGEIAAAATTTMTTAIAIARITRALLVVAITATFYYTSSFISIIN